MEELYNFGPHTGLLAFEVGNPELSRERSNGLDLSLRHAGKRARGEFNLFYYDINDFVFLARTGEVRDGLLEGVYLQSDSRFIGSEFRLSLGLHDAVWVNLGLDWVDAELTHDGTPLPRIPPVKGRLGLDFRHKGLSFKPEIIMASDQDDVFRAETRTPGYIVVNLKASYTKPQRHLAHHFSLNVFNVGDRLYRNHLSFIKDLAPEIGRGVRFSYALKFF